VPYIFACPISEAQVCKRLESPRALNTPEALRPSALQRRAEGPRFYLTLRADSRCAPLFPLLFQFSSKRNKLKRSICHDEVQLMIFLFGEEKELSETRGQRARRKPGVWAAPQSCPTPARPGDPGSSSPTQRHSSAGEVSTPTRERFHHIYLLWRSLPPLAFSTKRVLLWQVTSEERPAFTPVVTVQRSRFAKRFVPVGLRERKRHKEKNSDKLGSTLEFKLILQCLWQLENKLSDEKEIKTLHQENCMIPSPKSKIRNRGREPGTAQE